MTAELNSAERRQLVDEFLRMAFPPNGVGMGTAQKDELGEPFKAKLVNGAARTAVCSFLKAVKASPSESVKGEMLRVLDSAFE